MQISRNSWLIKVIEKCHGKVPKEISICALFGKLTQNVLFFILAVVLSIIISVFLIIATPIAFLFGSRPCFIDAVKIENTSPFTNMPLPLISGIRLTPIMFVVLCIPSLEVIYSREIFQPKLVTYFSGLIYGNYFVHILSVFALMLIYIVFKDFFRRITRSIGEFFTRFVSMIGKTCIMIKVVD